MALNQLLNDDQFEVAALLTTLTKGYDRISMHGVRETLLDQQAESIGLALEKIWIPQQASNEIYLKMMGEALKEYKQKGITRVVFGDIFLEDVRAFREKQLKEFDMQGVFPLWGRDTNELAKEFIEQGFKAITCCVDNQSLEMRGLLVGKSTLIFLIHYLKAQILVVKMENFIHLYMMDQYLKCQSILRLVKKFCSTTGFIIVIYCRDKFVKTG